jgi:hypothetical protein
MVRWHQPHSPIATPHLLSAEHEGAPRLQWCCLFGDGLSHEQAIPVDLGEPVIVNRPGDSQVVPVAPALNILGGLVAAAAGSKSDGTGVVGWGLEVGGGV